MERRQRALFLCVHNSARSQMAEGLLRHLGGDRFDVASAGVEATYVRPLAVQAMREIGIDISQQRSKTVDEFMDQEFDLVVTVCGGYESCPIPPRALRLRHWPFEDPARGEGIEAFRNVRDGLKRLIEIELLDEHDVAAGGRTAGADL